jgi:cysteinyl-tRNA synthetase
MSLLVYNTLTRQKEDFQPLDPPQVGMYVCGITPYDETHVGHGRAYVTFDAIRRYLEHLGYAVTYVQNITDIDDKIIEKSKLQNPNFKNKPENTDFKQMCAAVAEQYTDSFFEVMDKLNVKRAALYPKATDHIPDMVKWISGLIDKGAAYALKDGIYFEVDKDEGYGKLSGKKKEEQEAGARVDVHEGKKSPLDFALWKFAKPGEPSWPSPWGDGRPGWHIECSAMSTKYLGEQFDIHGGGLDLEFPHHENEIAQTESLTGKVPWVKYWIHNGFVNVNKQKMSKSLGNFFTLKDVFAKFDPMVVRFFILSNHYRSPINYSDQELAGAREAFGRITAFIADLDFLITHPPSPSLKKRGGEKEIEIIELEDIQEELVSYQEKFTAAMDDDFNTAGAIGAIFEAIRYCRKSLDYGDAEQECLEVMRKTVVDLCAVLGLTVEGRGTGGAGDGVESLIKEREAARQSKDFRRSDEIRQQLNGQGIELEDTPYGTKWKKGVAKK